MLFNFFSIEENEDDLIVDNPDLINNIENYILLMKEILKKEQLEDTTLKKFKILNEEIYSFLLTNKMIGNTIGLSFEQLDELIKELKDSIDNIYTDKDLDMLTFSFEIQIHLLNILKSKL